MDKEKERTADVLFERLHREWKKSGVRGAHTAPRGPDGGT
jgi:hypothetical protein